MDEVLIIYKRKEYKVEKGTTLHNLSENFKEDYKDDIIVGSIDNYICDLDEPIIKDCTIEFFDLNSTVGNKAYERGLSFLFAKAIKDVLNSDVKIEHSLDKGIYCEILFNNQIDQVIIEKIKIRMRELTTLSFPLEKITVSRLETMDYYTKIGQYEKAKSLRYISNTSISLYKLDNMLDYYYGPLPVNTKYIKKYDIKFIEDNCVVLLYPNIYNDNEKLEYQHHKKLFEEFRSYSNWSHKLGINTVSDLNEVTSCSKYNDIIRIAEATQTNKLFEITNEIISNDNIKIILITGPSSSGKTTTANKLGMFLQSKGKVPHSISLDDYFFDRVDTPKGKDGKEDYESVSAIDSNLFKEKIMALLEGKSVRLPRYDFMTGEKELCKEEIKLHKEDILIIEGLHTFNEKIVGVLPQKNLYKIYLSPLTVLNIDNHNRIRTTDNRLVRRMVRDNRGRGYDASKTLASWPKVRKGEEEYIFPYQDNADVVFNTSLIYELAVLKIYVEPLLFGISQEDPNYPEALRIINLFRSVLSIPSEEVPQDSILREFIGGSCFK